MSADNIFQQRHTEESVYDVDHLPYSLLYEQPQAPVQSSYTVYSYEPNQQGQYQFIPQRTEAPPSPTYAPQAFPAAPLPPQGVMPPPAVGVSPLKYVALYWVRAYVPMAIMLLSLVFIYFILLRDAQEYYLLMSILFVIPNIPYMVNIILQAFCASFYSKKKSLGVVRAINIYGFVACGLPMVVAFAINPFILPLLVFDIAMGIFYMLEIASHRRQEEAARMFASQPMYPNNGVVPPQFAYPSAAPIPLTQQAVQAPYPHPPATPDVRPNQERTQ
ncbi:hypothetical protein ES20_08795 [Rothia aeria]|uniref:hypothetical protein n=1 Tax=Rothia aeria TaxID=172042 RepID=UPI00051D7816|nr:hypothetical protein [Rothia aeria]KGI99951.1 hypothetical protein ES20_08795 [Rothia aeria]